MSDKLVVTQQEELDRFLDIWLEGKKSGNIEEEPSSHKKTLWQSVVREIKRGLREEVINPIEPYEGENEQTKKSHKLSHRTIASLIILLIMVPITVVVGIVFMGNRQYYFISLMLVLYAMIPFFMVFEDRKPQARELVVIATLSAITVAGRAAFFMVPNFKPIAALVIISAVTFGSEAGFLVGCISIIVSNFLFGQGPWTPWQMISYGLIGFLAGILFQKGKLKRTRLSLSIYGFFSVIFIFGGIMNPASLIMWTNTITWQGLLAYYMSGFPVDLVQAGSTVLFLWVASKPMIEKLERIKKKYGLLG
jgi:uncharacterized membrane protein